MGVVTQAAKAVNAWIEQDRPLRGDVATVTERRDWKPTLWLRHQDVVQPISVKVGYPTRARRPWPPLTCNSNRPGQLSSYRSWAPCSTGVSNHNDCVETAYAYGVDDSLEDLRLANCLIAWRRMSPTVDAEHPENSGRRSLMAHLPTRGPPGETTAHADDKVSIDRP